MAATRQKVAGYSQIIPRASTFGSNFMQNSLVSTLSQSASEEYAFFPIPANCLVVGGVIKGSQQAGVSGQAIVKLGTNVTDSLFGTFTISATALNTRLVLGVITVSTSDDHLPYQCDVLLSLTSGSSATTSLSMYVQLEYVMPGKA